MEKKKLDFDILDLQFCYAYFRLPVFKSPGKVLTRQRGSWLKVLPLNSRYTWDDLDKRANFKTNQLKSFFY